MAWTKSKYPGVRYREHPSRKHGRGPDRYFSIRYDRADGHKAEEGLGWASEGWSAERAAELRSRIRSAIKTGEGAQSLAEQREHAKDRQRVKLIEAEREAAENITLADLAERYLAFAAGNKRTASTDRTYIERHILPRLGELRAKDISLAHAEALKQAMSEKYAVATVRQCLTILRRIFNWASVTPISEENARPLFGGVNPVKGLAMPQKDNARVRFFSREEATALLALAENRHKPTHDACLLSLFAGLRKSEILHLKFSDIDFAHAVLHVFDSKNARTGSVPLNSRLIEMLTARRAASPDPQGRVFVAEQGGARMRRLSHRFSELANELGFNAGVSDPRQKACFHTLRHTFASWLVISGCDIYRVKDLMRHKCIEMTMRYAHLRPDATRAAVEGLSL